MIAESPSGRILLANDQLETILGFPRSELHQIAGGEKYQGFDEDGVELRPEDWPLARAVRGETVPYQEIEPSGPTAADLGREAGRSRPRPRRQRHRRRRHDHRHLRPALARENRRVLSTARRSSLVARLRRDDPRVAEAVVPASPTGSPVDILDDKGVPRRVAVAHEDPAKVALAPSSSSATRRPECARGTAYVLRTGQRDAESNVTDELFEAAAQDPSTSR